MVVVEKARGITIMDMATNNSQKNENRDVEGINDGVRAQASIISERKVEHKKVNSSSSSTSSGSSSEDDFFQLTATALTKPITGEATERSNAELEKPLGATNSSPADDKPGNRAVFIGSEDPDRDSSGRLVGPIQRPIQESGRIDGYDPNRIPASVFARPKSTAPGDWSTASNESLFSIQMGNSSFSRDHVFLIGRSGDPGDFSYSPPPGAAPSAVPSTFHSGEMSLGRSGHSGRTASAEQTNAEAMKDVMKAVEEEHANGRVVPAEGTLHSSSSSRRSDASSIQSFAFPILPGGIGSLKVVPEQQPQKPEPESKEAAVLHSPRGPPKPPPPHYKWLLCFSCSFCHTD